jgi:hypothetical protein
MVFHKLNKNILNLISENLSKQNTKELDSNNNNVLAINEKTVNNGGIILNHGASQLNTLVNRIGLHYELQDQIEEVSDNAVEN